MQVHFQLATLKKGNSSVTDYFHKMKTLIDTLAAYGQPLNDFETVSFLLAGLGLEFDHLVTSVTTRVDPISRDDIYGLLLAYEMCLEQRMATTDLSNSSTHFTARNLGNSGQRGKGFNAARGFSPMVMATMVLFRAYVVPPLVDVVVTSTSILMLQAPPVSSICFATSQDTMPSPTISILISPLSMTLCPTCRLSTPLLAYRLMTVGAMIQGPLTISQVICTIST
jgi:hypothetical protein